ARHVAELGRQIDSGDTAAETLCDVACRPAQAAADIQDVIVGRGGQQVRYFDRRLQSATVKLVIGRQGVDAGPGGIGTIVEQSGVQACEQIALRVVRGDLVRVGHRSRR